MQLLLHENRNPVLIESGELNGSEYSIWEFKNEKWLRSKGLPFYWVYGKHEQNYAKSYETAKEVINEVSKIKVYTPQEIYDSHVRDVFKNEEIADIINDVYYVRPFKFNPVKLKEQTRVEIKFHGYETNSFHVINIMSIWLDKIPFMILLNAIDPEDGYGSEYVTNEEKYCEFVAYLHSLSTPLFPVIHKDERVLKGIQPGLSIYIQEGMEPK